MSHFSLLLLAVLALPTCGAAQMLEARLKLATAEELLRQGKKEWAAVELRGAVVALAAAKAPKKERAKLEKRIAAQFGKVDKRDRALRKLLNTAARDMRKSAKGYEKADWAQTAAELRGLADRVAAVLIPAVPGAGSKKATPPIDAALQEVEKLAPSEPEQAGALLRRSWRRLCADRELPAAERTALQKKARKLFESVDPRGMALEVSLGRHFQQLQRVAKQYTRQRWQGTAAAVLQRAGSLCPERMPAALKALGVKSEDGAALLQPAPLGLGSLATRFAGFVRTSRSAAWKERDGWLESRKLKNHDSDMLVASRPLRRAIVRLEIRAPKEGVGGFVFALEKADTELGVGNKVGYMVQIWNRKMLRVHQLKGGKYHAAFKKWVDLSAPEWIELQMVLDGKTLRARVPGMADFATVKLERESRGSIGLWVSRGGARNKGVQAAFRGLVIAEF